MQITHLVPAFTDARGAITDVLQHTPFDSATIITSARGAVRGNHYHRQSLQYLYVLSGHIRAFAQPPEGAVEAADLGPGDLLTTPQLERHAIEALEDSTLLVLTLGPRGGAGYEDDTYRVPPLHRP